MIEETASAAGWESVTRPLDRLLMTALQESTLLGISHQTP